MTVALGRLKMKNEPPTQGDSESEWGIATISVVTVALVSVRLIPNRKIEPSVHEAIFVVVALVTV